MTVQAQAIDVTLDSLGRSIDSGDWQEATSLIREMDQWLRSTDPGCAHVSTAMLEHLRGELQRMQRLSEARRGQIGDQLRVMARGRKALRQYA